MSQYVQEQMLNSKEYKKIHPEIGTDIKIIANRVEKQIDFTMCIPFIATHTPSRVFYEKRKMELKEEIITFLKELNSEYTGCALILGTTTKRFI